MPESRHCSVMEGSALNRAHLSERKADALLRRLKFDEAIACHQKTADLLLEAMQLTNVEKVLESLRLQHDYHLRRQSLIRHKQLLVGKLCQKKEMSRLDSAPECNDGLNSSSKFHSTRTAIYKNIDENDSLLRGLIAPPEQAAVRSAPRAPKGDKVVIEELRMNNEALRKFVDELITQLDTSRQENKRLRVEVEELKGQIRQFEKERRKLKVVTTDSGSPFILSPSSELSPIGFSGLPALAPLEMPNFDFAKFNAAATTTSGSSSSNSETLSS